jgi:hypothetical protein
MCHSLALPSEMTDSQVGESTASFGRLYPAMTNYQAWDQRSGVCRDGQLFSVLLATGRGRSRQQPAQFSKRRTQLVPVHDHVNHAMFGEVFGALKAVR